MTSTAGSLIHGVMRRSAGSTPRGWLKVVAKTGLAARAVIYAVLGILAFLIVTRGHSPSQTSGEGALAEIVKQPAGPLLLGLLSTGLIAYGAWRLIQTVTGIEPASDQPTSMWMRIRWLAIAVIYLVLFADSISILAGGGGSSGGASSHPKPYAAQVLALPAGPVLLGLVGAAIVTAGVAFATWGCVHDYSTALQEGRMGETAKLAARITGIFGNFTRGALAVLVGLYFLIGAVHDQPGNVKSLDQALQSLSHQPTGPLWLTVAALGLLSFSAYSAFEVVYRKV
ncbi:MAG: DUF1206 domain-containing protein [Acidimicrobiales bacterium]